MTTTRGARQSKRAATRKVPDGILPLVKRARRRRLARDGALELATAIAAISGAVRLDGSREPFVTEPAGLFDRSFAEVGIGEEQMALLRGQLKRLLPEIAQELDDNARVLDQPGHRIDDYWAFVRVALLLKVR